MRGKTAWGIGRGLDGREAARYAVQQAFAHLGTARPTAAIAFISQEYNTTDAINGLIGLLGTLPLWGFSTVSPFNAEGEHGGTILLAILSGSDLKAQSAFIPADALQNIGSKPFIEQFGEINFKPQSLLLAADGVTPQLDLFIQQVTQLSLPIMGCLASGEYVLGHTVQLAAGKGAAGAVAALLLGDHFRISTAIEHGWKDIGVLLQVTRSQDFHLEQLDNFPANETLAHIFGYGANQWLYHPLKDLARLYPLGVEVFPGSADLVLRSPLFVEPNGSLRTNAAVTEGLVAHLMVGDPQACIQAAVSAARQARQGLGRAQPILAVVFADLAWHMLFKTSQNDWIGPLNEELEGVPMIGAYTLGQIARPTLESSPQLYNQHIMVTFIGQAA